MTLWQSYFGGRRGGSCAVERRSAQTRYPSGSGCGAENRIQVCALSVMLGSCRCGSSCVFCVSLHIGVPRRRARAPRAPVRVVCALSVPPHTFDIRTHIERRIRGCAIPIARSQINLRFRTNVEDTHIQMQIHTDRTLRKRNQEPSAAGARAPRLHRTARRRGSVRSGAGAPHLRSKIRSRVHPDLLE